MLQAHIPSTTDLEQATAKTLAVNERKAPCPRQRSPLPGKRLPHDGQENGPPSRKPRRDERKCFSFPTVQKLESAQPTTAEGALDRSSVPRGRGKRAWPETALRSNSAALSRTTQAARLPPRSPPGKVNKRFGAGKRQPVKGIDRLTQQATPRLPVSHWPQLCLEHKSTQPQTGKCTQTVRGSGGGGTWTEQVPLLG